MVGQGVLDDFATSQQNIILNYYTATIFSQVSSYTWEHVLDVQLSSLCESIILHADMVL